ncbi:uncharacterized protein LOC111698160 [Eurytemora carolleeae]|uniref:uncharacterized protein LOC111698160 n=1 Tax=Eurytemora carolleeae TaxID=1294199 RepID=UPI000C78E548|nr:uncharacterized protein LOC111698160 [Eurytemora carolleeae]|eukprot:XP_023324185.1 uncharacterized protein LOC111698160 [Eurytemora affinis]
MELVDIGILGVVLAVAIISIHASDVTGASSDRPLRGIERQSLYADSITISRNKRNPRNNATKSKLNEKESGKNVKPSKEEKKKKKPKGQEKNKKRRQQRRGKDDKIEKKDDGKKGEKFQIISKKSNSNNDKKNDSEEKKKKDRKKKKEKKIKQAHKVIKLDQTRTLTRQVDDTCVKDLATLASVASNQARNFFQQANRILANNDIKTSKSGKKGNFKDPVKILINNLGGDPANLTCSGKAISNDTAKETTKTLEECEANITSACVASLPDANLTIVQECKTVTDDFRKLYIDLLGKNLPTKSAAEICQATKDSTLTTLMDQVRNCSFLTDIDKAQKEERGACDTAFKNCRQAERDTIATINRCATCPTAETAALEKAVLDSLENAFNKTEVALDAALKATGLNTGAGSNGTLPADALAGLANISTEGGLRDGCKAILQGFINFNRSAEASGSDPNKPLNQVNAAKAAEALNTIISRTTLLEDIRSCPPETIPGTYPRIVATSYVIVYIRFYIFWCINWRRVVVIIRIQVLINNFNVTTTTTPQITTRVPSGRLLQRDKLIKSVFLRKN